MHFITIVTIFTSATAAARSKGQRKQNFKELRVSDAKATCGDDLTVQCCNNIVNDGSNPNNVGGLLGLGLLNDANIFSNCADLSLNIVGLLDGLLTEKCGANVACCQENPDDFPSSSFLGVSLPCIALSNLI